MQNEGSNQEKFDDETNATILNADGQIARPYYSPLATPSISPLKNFL